MERDNQSAVNLSFNLSQLSSADELVNDILAPPTGSARFREFTPRPGPSMSYVAGEQEKAATLSGFAYTHRPAGLSYTSGELDKKALDRSYSPWTHRSSARDEERLAQQQSHPMSLRSSHFTRPGVITKILTSSYPV